MQKQPLQLTVNGHDSVVLAAPHDLLLDVLRDQLQLGGAREGCGVGICGACTVLLDGRPVSSCLYLAHLASGHEVQTIEGLAQEDGLHPVQEAFIAANAFQCGYCTPGFILTCVALLRENPTPSRHDIRRYLGGNLCRCTSYEEIITAVQCVAGERPAVP